MTQGVYRIPHIPDDGKRYSTRPLLPQKDRAAKLAASICRDYPDAEVTVIEQDGHIVVSFQAQGPCRPQRWTPMNRCGDSNAAPQRPVLPIPSTPADPGVWQRRYEAALTEWRGYYQAKRRAIGQRQERTIPPEDDRGVYVRSKCIRRKLGRWLAAKLRPFHGKADWWKLIPRDYKELEAILGLPVTRWSRLGGRRRAGGLRAAVRYGRRELASHKDYIVQLARGLDIPWSMRPLDSWPHVEINWNDWIDLEFLRACWDAAKARNKTP